MSERYSRWIDEAMWLIKEAKAEGASEIEVSIDYSVPIRVHVWFKETTDAE
jgi:hypothetical protein